MRLKSPRLALPLKFAAGCAAAGAGLAALLFAAGAFFRPDLRHRPAMPSPQEAAAARLDREALLDTAHPPVIWRNVDYREGSRGRWWPKGQSPILADLERQGLLPPVAQRTGPEPVVLAGVDGLGKYGGTWHRLAISPQDLQGNLGTRFSDISLVRWSPQGYPIVPFLAKSWTSSPDFRTWTFVLRRGLRWSDGQRFTTDDILFWWQWEVLYFKSEEPNSGGSDFGFMRNAGKLGSIEKVDDLTVRFRFDDPNALFLEKLAGAFDYFRPVHYLKKFHPALGDPKLIAETMSAMGLPSPEAVYARMKDWLNPECPRMWPWVYRDYKTAAPQALVRNPYYFAVDPEGNQLPYLDRFMIDVKNKDLITAAVAGGEESLQDSHLDFEDYTLLSGEAKPEGYSLLHWYSATRSAELICPNENRFVDPARPETAWKRHFLQDKTFRQALSLAIDRRQIIDAVFNGVGEPAQDSPGPESPYFDPRQYSAYTQYEPARANAMLDNVGLTRRDHEGFRTFPDGTRMTWFLNLTDNFPPDTAYLVARQWVAVGIRAVVQVHVRTLWFVEQAAREQDFTVWAGLEEFMPMLDARYFVPVSSFSFFAPAWGRWYQAGGLRGDPAASQPGMEAPPPGSPALRAMELYNEAQAAPNAAIRRARFHDIMELNADNVWTINISTSPPILAAVKDGFRNVPTRAVSGYFFMTPANLGMETFYWDTPNDTPAATTQIEASLARPSFLPRSPESGAAARSASAWQWLGRAILLLLAAGLVWAAVRYPFVGRRLLVLIPTLLATSVIVFAVVQLPPGDFITSKTIELSLNGDPNAADQLADLRKTFHFDEPAWQRYARWMGLPWFVTYRRADAGLLQGDLGRSMENNLPVNEILGDRLALTAVIASLTILLTWGLAVPIGIYSAVRRYTVGDYTLTLLGFLGMSVPPFLFALVLMFASSKYLGVSVSGLFSVRYAADPAWSWGKVADLLRHVWVPVVVLGFGSTAVMVRVMRANLLDELKKPYVVVARAKGVRPLRLLLKYPVRIALNPFVSGIAGLFPQLISGGAIVALVLSLPTIGPMLLLALLNEDTYFAASMLMLLSLLGMVGTLVSDLVLLWLDPRIRYEGGRK